MYSVQKRDFMGQWVELYMAMQFEDAHRHMDGVSKGSAGAAVRIMKI